MTTLLDHLRRAAHVRDAGLTDGALLERFLASRDGDAFAGLLRRHGPMVWGVCRRLLGQEQDAEDAFQATFLVLARKAASVRPRDQVGNWLYGVAYRTSLKAKAMSTKRRTQERALPPPAPVSGTEVTDDWLPLLDRELSRLPEMYRAAIVLCDLEGRSRREAARQLGWPEGTLSGRLARARALLAKHLARYGLPVAAAVALSRAAASGCPPVPLVTATAQAALQTAGAAEVSARVAALVEGVLKGMLLTNMLKPTVVMLAVALLGAAVGALSWALGASASPAVGLAEEPPPQRQRDERVAQAVARGVEYLKRTQREGKWEHHPSAQGHQGGFTALALLALLEAGVDADQEPVRQGLDYLRDLELRQTYTVSLQTLLLCRAGAREDRIRLRRNVEALLASRQRDEQGRFLGWTYVTSAGAGRADNSNTQFAIQALHAARKAGLPIEPEVWKEIQSYYLRTQQADGGWVYAAQNPGRSTVTMTCAGLSGLLLSREHLPEKTQGLDEALARGFIYVGQNLTLAARPNRFYCLHDLGRTGRLAGKRVFVGKQDGRPRDWYQEGAAFLLREQKADGSWQDGAEQQPIIATSFALLFLGKGP